MKLSDNTKLKLRRVGLWLVNPVVWMWFAPLLYVAPNIGLDITELYPLPVKFTNLLLPLGIYGFLMSLSQKLGRSLLFFFPIMFFAAFQIVLLFLYGESIIAIDMYVNVLTTSVTEATELLGNLKEAIVVVCLMYLPPLVAGIVMMCRKVRAREADLVRLRRVSYWVMSAGAVCFVWSLFFAEDFMPRRQLFPYNVIENLGTAIYRTNESMHYHQTSATFSYSPTMTRDKNRREVFVVVIGETSRADNWQLFGYSRPTTPRLSVRRNVYAFPKTLSEINTTHKAVPMLLSYLTPENFGDSVAHTKSIFSAFNDLGYQTAFLSNQRRNHSYIDYYGQEAQFDRFITDNGGPMRDMNLVEPMKQVIENSPSNKVFIVLHTYGSHFEYRKRYDEENAFFTPDNNSGAKAENRPQLINAYDNTIRYTDALLDKVMESVEQLDVDAAVIYVSDHGEDIFDDERGRFLHSSPTPTYYQIHVPMVVWLSDSFIEQHPGVAENLKKNSGKNVASTSALFHTILDITGVRSPFYDASMSLASPQYREPERRYLNDYNESVPLRKSGLREQDFQMFRQNNISY